MQEIQLNGFTYEVKWIHGGQYHPYGDTFRVAEIRTVDTNHENILDVMKTFFRMDVPLKKDWNTGDIQSYFEGYCEVEKTYYGFKYTKCEPYTD